MAEDKDPNILLDVKDPVSGQSVLGFNPTYIGRRYDFHFAGRVVKSEVSDSHAFCELDEDGNPTSLVITVSLKPCGV